MFNTQNIMIDINNLIENSKENKIKKIKLIDWV